MKSKIWQIDQFRSKRLLNISGTQKTVLEGAPITNSYGLYWLYTNYTLSDLISSTKAPLQGAIDMAGLANDRQCLAHICNISDQGFRIVYNGIGGVGNKGTGGLKERILQQFSGGKGTGSLAIKKSSLSDLSRWKYSYVILQGDTVDIDLQYSSWAEKLENAWRLEFGWPILCNQ
jgi:hypothetical protein